MRVRVCSRFGCFALRSGFGTACSTYAQTSIAGDPSTSFTTSRKVQAS